MLFRIFILYISNLLKKLLHVYSLHDFLMQFLLSTSCQMPTLHFSNHVFFVLVLHSCKVIVIKVLDKVDQIVGAHGFSLATHWCRRVVSKRFHHWRFRCGHGVSRKVSHSNTRNTQSRRGATKMPCSRRNQPIGVHHIYCIAKILFFPNESFYFDVHRFTKFQQHSPIFRQFCFPLYSSTTN